MTIERKRSAKRIQTRDTGGGPTDAHLHPLMFDPWLLCGHLYVRVIADNILSFWENWEDRQRRERTLRQADRENREMVLRAVMANLAFVIASGHPRPGVGVSLQAAKRKTSRYDRTGFAGLPKMISSLAAPEHHALLSLRTSRTKGVASSIDPAPWLVADLQRFRFALRHFGRASGQELIVLGRVVRRSGRVVARERIDYGEADAKATEHFRSEMRRINDFLASAPIGFEDDGGPPVLTGARTLRRHFNLPADAPPGTVRFDLGGRLFGTAWWAALPEARRRGIRIEGEEIADLDFSSMFLRLAYIEAGLLPPAGDLYAGIEGLSDPKWRPGVKRLVSALWFRENVLLSVPMGTRAALPPDVPAPEFRRAIVAAHPGLVGVFETGIGLRLMFLESQILIAALLALADAGVTALPMHDGLMVAASNREIAAQIMGDAAEKVVGHRLPTHCTD